MYDLFALRRLGISAAAAVLALALSACGGGGGGGSPAELAAAPASGNGGAAPADGNSAAAGAPPGAGEGGGSPPVESAPVESAPVEPGAGDPAPGVPVGEAPGAGGPAAPGRGSASPSGAAWHVFGEVGTGPNGGALVTAEDLAGIRTMALFYASKGASPGRWASGDVPNISQSDAWLARGSYPGMAVRVGHNDAGQVSYDLTYRESSPSSESWTLDSEAAGTNVRRWSSGGQKGAMFRRETDAGNLWAAVATDISGPGDTDWLATGVWAYAPAGGPQTRRLPGWGTDSSSGYRFGVFADGGDPFRSSGLAGLTGTATYEGDAAGIYTRQTGAWIPDDYFYTKASRSNRFFTADATLTVDFSGGTGYRAGSAAGRIHNIEIDGTPFAGNPDITLVGGRVNGLDVNGVMIRDNRTADIITENEVWRGRWIAALFGNPDTGAAGADRSPGSVAGTFGVRRQAGARPTDAFIGAFVAHRTAWTEAP